TGDEGLKACRADHPDLILLDFVLPDMKGDEVCRELLNDPVTASIPVLYVSGLGSELTQERPDLPNIIGLLSKPFTSEKLLAAVRHHVDPESAAKESKPVEPAREFSFPIASPRQPVPPIAPVLSSLGSTNGPDPVAPVAERPAIPPVAGERPSVLE